jgi:V/A-type H+-transporting ATPase subunit A
MEAARSIREDFLHQLAFHEIDTYTSLKKQFYMMSLVLEYYDKANAALEMNADIEKLVAIPSREAIGRFKYIKEEDIDSEFEKTLSLLDNDINEVINAKEEY